MSDYLMRSGAPFDEKMWATIDREVVEVAKHVLVARRFVHIVGPLGWGVEAAPLFSFDERANAAKETTKYVPLEELSQEFLLRAKHLAMAAQTPFGLDLGPIAMAATKLAKAEDAYVLGGLAKQAQSTGALGDWSVPGAPFKAIAEAAATLLEAGCDGPYALVLCPHRHAQLAGLQQNGIREIEMIEKLAKGGIFQFTGLDCSQALVLSPAPWNFDLVVGQDVVTGYLGNAGLDQTFRIFETLALRVKRPKSICVLK